jgi:hypothetical protein
MITDIDSVIHSRYSVFIYEIVYSVK